MAPQPPGRPDLRRRIVGPALEAQAPAVSYPTGSWGPEAADEMIAADGGWHCPELDPSGDQSPE